MSDSDFRRRIKYLLLTHREGSPLGDCAPCARARIDWPAYRDHLTNLIAAERHEADQQRRAAGPKDFAELLALHAPMTARGGNLLCGECLDGRGAGEFPTTAAWVTHVRAAMTEAEMKVIPA